MDAVVEVLLLSADADGLRHRRTTAALAGRSPDAAALDLARDVVVLHSTSWRWADGRVVLTYAALPDPDPSAALPLAEPSIVSSGDPLRPRPPDLHAHHVAAHAARHLALLLETDPAVREAAARLPQDLLRHLRAAAAFPVGTHAEAHAAAHQGVATSSG